ncbi:hypothetical protein SCMU_08260 [Sinomonas cyclohexanicum]|uniref:Uncharacterized protein n=1 Tax=Sinomonas cyclohexanicum TaxID=322009 RepID=A0ABM7PS02_SINCY|nr:hypothetical protein SCMU_08260 [Corynebacterium cyclohexanicum]
MPFVAPHVAAATGAKKPATSAPQTALIAKKATILPTAVAASLALAMFRILRTPNRTGETFTGGLRRGA